MATTVVGLFDNRQEADAARADLIREGFKDDGIRVVAQQAGTQTTGTTTAVTGDRSLWEDVKDFFGFGHEDEGYEYEEGIRRGGILVAVSAAPDRIERATDILMRHNPVDIDRRAEEWRSAGWNGGATMPATAKADTRATAAAATRPPVAPKAQPAANATTSGTAAAASARTQQAGEQAIPVVEEELQVGKRQVQRGVRIFQHVTERPVQEQVELRDERVTVERRAVDRPATDLGNAFQDKTIEVTEIHEEPVVSKQAHVVEEVVVNKQANTRTETVRDTVRRTDVEVQQAGQSASGGDEIYEQFGSQLASDQRFRGRDWDSVESDARQSFERSHPGSKWDEFRDKVHRAYDRAKSRV